MAKLTTIHVTQGDIRACIPGFATTCPVQRRLNLSTGMGTHWLVGVYSLTFIGPRGGHRTIRCPVRVARFIMRFDRRLPVKPFKFRIKI